MATKARRATIKTAMAKRAEPSQDLPSPSLYKVVFGTYGLDPSRKILVDAMDPIEALERAIERSRGSSMTVHRGGISIGLEQTVGAGLGVADERPESCGPQCGVGCACY